MRQPLQEDRGPEGQGSGLRRSGLHQRLCRSELQPRAAGLRARSTYFSATPFSGSHEAGVQGVVNGQFDAAATYINNEKSGIPQRMVTKGMIKEGEVCNIWTSPEITSGPFTARANLPAELIADMRAAVKAVPEADPAAHKEMTGAENSTAKGYVEVDHDRYQWIVDMRAWLKAQRKS
ncbi:MAG: PhnD/SsuA/transferrin family substrate-binding protein [Rhizobium sp.]|nr:PhnD/SsuA/transferrin family substrate-binding protein [Rhizobium sp.]